jgi:prolyl oligopeptidase
MKYPQAKKENIEEIIFGKKVEDSYRWMENENDTELKKWIEDQSNLTFEYLNGVSFKNKIKNRLKELYNYSKYFFSKSVGGKIIFSSNNGLQNQNIYYIQENIQEKAEILIDPNTMSEDGTVSVTLNTSSKDNKYLSFLQSQSGSDWQELKVINLETKETLKDIIKWVKFTYVSWYKDGFFYSRYDIPEKGKELSEKNEDMKIYYHKLGEEQSKDKLIFQDKDNPLRYSTAFVTKDEKYLVLSVSEGTYGNEIRIKKTDEESDFKIVFKGFSNEYNYIDSLNGDLIFLTDEDAPNKKVIKLNPETLKVETLIEEKSNTLENVFSTGDKIFTVYLENVSSKVLQYNINGDYEREINLPALGTVYEINGEKDKENIFFSFTSFTYPTTLFVFNKNNGEINEFKKPELNFNISEFETKQIFCESKDGTKIPVFLTYKKGLKLNGENPALLYAYGGFNVTIPPAFNPSMIFFIENGGVYAQANIRGGAEYGESWHKNGMLLKKQNVFDDFIAAAEYLIDNGYTSKEKLAVHGRSNGGVLIGAVINQRPDLFKVAFPQVGVMDMLRYHKFTIGWGWIVEYGNPEEEIHFKNILKYSPLHNIEEKEYPAVMVMTADHDDRVVPAHSYKYTAMLQEKNTSNNPILIRIDTKAGHGAGKSIEKLIEEISDQFTFLFINVNIKL